MLDTARQPIDQSSLADRTYDIRRAYGRINRRRYVFLLLSLACIFIITVVSTSLGSYHLKPWEVLAIITNSLFNAYDPDQTREVVVLMLRLPRILTGILSGIGLGVSGAVMQGVLRNPLASPTTIGISGAAGLGAALAILADVGLVGGQFLLVGNAFLFSLIPITVIYLLSRFNRSSPETMILAGIGMLYIFTSLTSLLQFFASEYAVKSMVVWLMGDLGRAKWGEISIILIVLVFCLPLLLWKAWDLNVMAIGDETARSLGINPDRSRVFLMLLSSLVTATAICFTGIIGFIGLVAPHICRMTIGGDNRFLIPASGVFGAGFLLFADAVARTLMAPVIIPVGIITGCAGGLLFIYLVLKQKKRNW